MEKKYFETKEGSVEEKINTIGLNMKLQLTQHTHLTLN